MNGQSTSQSKTGAKWRLNDVLLVIFCTSAIIIALNIVLFLIGAPEYFLSVENKSGLALGLFLLQEAVFILPLYFLVVKKYRLGWKDFGINKISFRRIVKFVALGWLWVIVFNFLLAAAVMLLNRAIPGFLGQEPVAPLFGKTAADTVIAVAVLVVIAPVVEEIFFRGFILNGLLSRFSAFTSSAVSAVFFAAVHFEFQSIGIIVFLAFVLNWIFLKSRSLWPCIVFHMFNNAFAFFA